MSYLAQLLIVSEAAKGEKQHQPPLHGERAQTGARARGNPPVARSQRHSCGNAPCLLQSSGQRKGTAQSSPVQPG